MYHSRLQSLLRSNNSSTVVVVVSKRWNNMVQRRPFSDGKSTTRTSVTGATMDGKKVIEIPAHTMTFTVLFIPCAILAIYMMSYGPDEERVNDEVRAHYGNNLQIQQKNQALKEFFMNAEQGIEDQRLQQVLYGGKGEKKRFHAVDKELYGTEQGLVVKQQVTEELQQTAAEKKRQRKEQRRLKKKKASIDAVAAEVNDNDKDAAPSSSQSSSTLLSTVSTKLRTAVASIDRETVQTVATYSLIGTVAIVIGFFAGSSSSSSRRS